MSFFENFSWRRWLYDGLPLLAWMALIFVLSSRSVLIEIENEGGEKLFYKSAHFFAYAILAWLWWRVLSPSRQADWPVLLTALALTVLYGISDEIHQLYVPGRHARLADILFDTSGGLATVLLLRLVPRARRFPETLLLFLPPGNERLLQTGKLSQNWSKRPETQ